MRGVLAAACVWFFTPPLLAHGAVTISEVAWMGDTESANNEWIELYNDGPAVALDGWVLEDGMNLQIDLAGTIPAGSYAVLERTDDGSAPGTAFLIYTGALVNTGATLTLRRSDGQIEDQVAGGEDWKQIGGDNTTKETAQYTENGWMTGTPTPGSVHISSTPPVQDDTETDSESPPTTPTTVTTTSKSKEKESGKSTTIQLPEAELRLTLRAPDIAYVHQPVSLSIEPSGISEVLLNSVQVAWNFGDLETARGQEVTHTYAYPGTYVIIAQGSFYEHSASVRHEITVLPVVFSLAQTASGDLQIHNNARYEVDLSGYSLRTDKTRVFPQNTIMLPNSTITIPKEEVGSGIAFLLDQAHTIVASTMAFQEYRGVAAEDFPVATAEGAKPPPQLHVQSPQNTSADFSFADEVTETKVTNMPEKGEEELLTRIPQSATVAEASTPIPEDALPYLGLIGILSLGILALYAGRIPGMKK